MPRKQTISILGSSSSGLSPDRAAFPPIKNPEIATLKEADGKAVRDEELVLGVVVGQTARAYPINTLTGPRREIINDHLDGEPIAATW